jgi:hypothetical protein
MFTLDQVLPFQCWLTLDAPTAQQSEVLRHVTACPPPVLVVLTIDHAVPFQCSMSVAPPVALNHEPTAQQFDALRQVTPSRRVSGASAFGVATIDHVLPFQCSARVRVVPAPE